MGKPKVALYWCASCGGCEEAVVDLAEDILGVIEAVDIVFWPVALDFKREDIEAMPDGEIAVSFINGAVRSSEQREMVELLRKKSNLVIAFGSCAHLGGIPGLANLSNRDGIFNQVYKEAFSIDNDDNIIPQTETTVTEGGLSLPLLWDTVKTLDQVIEVDYYLPGCPPPVNLIKEAFDAILNNRLPDKGAVLAPDVALCEECPRRDSKPEKIDLSEIKRPQEILMDGEKCLLAQGLLCLGPVTRKGCGAACISTNMPCTGCMGPTGNVRDFGAKAISAMASVIGSKDEDEISKILNGITDPIGTFYRYSLPASLMHRRYQAVSEGDPRS
jgi:F420-non-reducing hydrogenase small subunit